MVLLRILICVVFAVLYAGAAVFSSVDVLYNLSAPISTVAAVVAGVTILFLIGAAVVIQRSTLIYKTTSLIGVAVLLFVIEVLLQDGAQSYVRAAYASKWQQVKAGLRVTELDDQPLLTASGGPIGVRLILTLESTEDADIAFTPYAEGPVTHSMSFLPVRETRDPPFDPESNLFRAGQTYRLSYDLAPSILDWDRDQARFCLLYRIDSAFFPLKSDLGATPLELKFGGVLFEGTPQSWDFEATTKNSYDLTVFAESALAADFPLCDPASGG